MSKFEELCSAYKQAVDAWWAYRDEALQFAQMLITRYLTYLEIPLCDWRFVPVEQDPESTRTYNCLEAMHLSPDMLWHLGLQIAVYGAPNEYPRQRLTMHLLFRKAAPQTFLVKIAANDPGHTIAMDNEDTFTVFFDFLQVQILRHFQDRPRNFPQHPASLGEIGFIDQ